MGLRLEPTNPSFLTKKQGRISKIVETRSYERDNQPSPVFQFKNSEITAGSSELFDFFEDKPAMKKYGVMKNLVLTNNSTASIDVYLNQDSNRIINVPAGVVRALDEEEISGGVTSLKVVNTHATNTAAANLIIIETFRKGVQIETAFQRLHKKIFSIGG